MIGVQLLKGDSVPVKSKKYVKRFARAAAMEKRYPDKEQMQGRCLSTLEEVVLM
ncbi:hypothetical protein Tco_0739923, partial [Tanacetum coccineum]